MDADIPQWMPQAYVRAIQAAGSELPKEELKKACTNLVERWSSNDRHYHTIRHLIDTVTNVEKLIPEMHKPDLVRLAAWYHGVVFSTEEASTYTRNGGEDEKESAAFALYDLLRLGVPENNARRVAELVAGIRPKSGETPGSCEETSRLDLIDIDLQALRDAHLGTLSTEPQRYKTYIGLVRKEYAHIPLLAYLTARRTIVHKLLKRPVLFITPLARQWEGSARENLAAEVERIDAKIEALTSGTCCSGAEQHKRDALAAQVPVDSPNEHNTTNGEHHTTAIGENLSTRENEIHRSTPQADQAQPSTAHPSSPCVDSPHTDTTRADMPRIDSTRSNDTQTPDPSYFHEFADVSAVPHDTTITREEKAVSSREPFSDTSLSFTAKDREKLRSSLESCGELFEPGEKLPSDLTPEQRKQLRREKLAQEVRRRIEERQARGTRLSSDRRTTETSERYPTGRFSGPEARGTHTRGTETQSLQSQEAVATGSFTAPGDLSAIRIDGDSATRDDSATQSEIANFSSGPHADAGVYSSDGEPHSSHEDGTEAHRDRAEVHESQAEAHNPVTEDSENRVGLRENRVGVRENHVNAPGNRINAQDSPLSSVLSETGSRGPGQVEMHVDVPVNYGPSEDESGSQGDDPHEDKGQGDPHEDEGQGDPRAGNRRDDPREDEGQGDPRAGNRCDDPREGADRDRSHGGAGSAPRGADATGHASSNMSDFFSDSVMASESSTASADATHRAADSSSPESVSWEEEDARLSSSGDSSAGSSTVKFSQQPPSRFSEGWEDSDEDLLSSTADLPPLPSSSRSGMEREPEM